MKGLLTIDQPLTCFLSHCSWPSFARKLQCPGCTSISSSGEVESPLYNRFLGSYALHTDPIVRGNLVSVSVCQFVSVSVCQCVTLRTRRHVTRRLLAGRLGTSNSKLFRRPLLLPSCCCSCVLNCSLCVWKILKSFPSQISSICSR